MYYDSIKDPIRKYFLEKIQITALAQNQVSSLQASPTGKRESKQIQLSPVDAHPGKDFLQRQSYLFDADDGDVSPISPSKKKDRRYSINTQKVIRSKQADLSIKQQEQLQKSSENVIPTLVEGSLKTVGENDQIVQKGLVDQAEKLKMKLEQRRLNSFKNCRTVVT